MTGTDALSQRPVTGADALSRRPVTGTDTLSQRPVTGTDALTKSAQNDRYKLIFDNYKYLFII